MNKKISPYTCLPDLNTLQSDIGKLQWFLEFYDKRMKKLFCLKTNEQNNFEASFSVVWSSFSEFDEKYKNEIDHVKLFTSVPVYIDLKTGKLSTQKSKNSVLNINNAKILIKEMDFSFKNFGEKTYDNVYKGKLINIFEVDKEFLFAFWASNSNQNV